RNGSGRSFGCQRSRRAQRKNHGYRVGHQLSGQSRQPVEATIGRAIFNRNVATFDIASLLQALPSGAEHSIIELSACKQADQRHAGRLRARRERPRRYCADERHELAAAAHSITSSARASNVGGTIKPSALAVLRLIVSSYLVGCWTGSSATLAPLRIRST